MNRYRGSTLIELLAVISIVAIIAQVGFENADNFFSGQRVQSEAASFIQDIRTARFSAMSNQMYHRLMFRSDGLGYRLDMYDNGGAIDVADLNDAKNVYNSAFWTSILDQPPEREFDPEVVATFPSTLTVIFFKPDGLLVDSPVSNGAPIMDCIATFTYGGSSVQVELNSSGIAASQEYYEEPL